MNGVFTSIGTHCHVLVPGGSFPCHRKTHYFFGGGGGVADGCKGAGLWRVLARRAAPCTMRPVEGA